MMIDKKLDEIAEISLGLTYKRYITEKGSNFKVIVQKSFNKDGEFGDFDEVSLKNKFNKRYFSKSGDVLMKVRYPFDAVCIKEEKLVISDRIAIIRVNEDYNPDFIAHLLNSPNIKNQLYELNDRKNSYNTSIKNIKQLKLKVPDLKTQVKYSELLNTINLKIAEDLKQVEYDRNLKNAILNDLWGK